MPSQKNINSRRAIQHILGVSSGRLTCVESIAQPSHAVIKITHEKVNILVGHVRIGVVGISSRPVFHAAPKNDRAILDAENRSSHRLERTAVRLSDLGLGPSS